jgi:hypothetical protein
MLAAAWRCHRGSALPRLHPLLHVQRSGIAVRCARSAQTAAAAAAAATAPNAGAPLGRMGRAAQRLADSDRSLAFLGRWALWIRRSRRTRLAIRAFRTAVLCAGIWNLGSQHGMMTYAADPEGEARKNLIRMVRGTVGDGSDKSRLVDQKAGIVLPKGHPVHDRAARITARVLSAAQQVIETKASAWEKKHGKWTPKDTANEGADRGNEAEEYLRYRKAYRNLKQRWNVVVLNDQGINAFVTDLCPRTIFVHAQVGGTHTGRFCAVFFLCKLISELPRQTPDECKGNPNHLLSTPRSWHTRGRSTTVLSRLKWQAWTTPSSHL